nr:MAG TPA: hypothetical protein [Caudoviricetes sp.]
MKLPQHDKFFDMGGVAHQDSFPIKSNFMFLFIKKSIENIDV